jgi:3-(3-hydroxy-phenyl)propionate hydroxylase
MPTTQVLIAGAGPVGLCLGLGLAKRGIEVEVFEALPALSADARASTWHPPTLEMLDEWGVAQTVLKKGTIVDRLQFWERESKTLVAEFPYTLLAADTRFPCRFQCPQDRVTPILLDALLATGHARVHFGHRVTAVGQDDHGAWLHAEGPSGPVTARAPWLVGADGAKSAVRESLAIGLGGMTYEDRFLLVATHADLAAQFPGLGPVAYVFDPEEWVILMRLPDLLRVVFRLAPGVDPVAAQAPDAVAARLRRLLGTREAPAVLMHSIYAVHQRVADSFRVGRILLCGDAAHLNNPTGGMGMNSGIHDAWCLVQALSKVLAGGAVAELDHYAATRRRVAAEAVQRDADKNYRALTAREAGERSVRDQELRAAAADPAAARAFLRRSAMLDWREALS